MKADEVILNTKALKDKIYELELKMYWLAMEIGVDRKTISRWVRAKGPIIKRFNIKALARVLECQEEELTGTSK